MFASLAVVIVMLVPCEGSETYVNGKRVEDAIQLRSGASFMNILLYSMFQGVRVSRVIRVIV